MLQLADLSFRGNWRAAERAWAVRAVELAMDTTPRYLLVDATALTPVGLVELERLLHSVRSRLRCVFSYI